MLFFVFLITEKNQNVNESMKALACENREWEGSDADVGLH